jgi:hypothetical protein
VTPSLSPSLEEIKTKRGKRGKKRRKKGRKNHVRLK